MATVNRIAVIDYVRGWTIATLTYAAGALATVAVHRVLVGVGAVNPFSTGSLAPWVVPAVLSTAAALVAVRRKVTAAWWKWLILTMVVPTVAGTILATRLSGGSVQATSVTEAVVTHVALAGVLGISVGSVLNVVRRHLTLPGR